MKRQPRRWASSSPIVVLPEPETPIKRTIIRPLRGAPCRYGVSSESCAHHGEQPPRVIRAPLARETAHQRERDDRRGHTELDRLERSPAPFARIGHHRGDAGERFIVVEYPGA